MPRVKRWHAWDEAEGPQDALASSILRNIYQLGAGAGSVGWGPRDGEKMRNERLRIIYDICFFDVDVLYHLCVLSLLCCFHWDLLDQKVNY